MQKTQQSKLKPILLVPEYWEPSRERRKDGVNVTASPNLFSCAVISTITKSNLERKWLFQDANPVSKSQEGKPRQDPKQTHGGMLFTGSSATSILLSSLTKCNLGMKGVYLAYRLQSIINKSQGSNSSRNWSKDYGGMWLTLPLARSARLFI